MAQVRPANQYFLAGTRRQTGPTPVFEGDPGSGHGLIDGRGITGGDLGNRLTINGAGHDQGIWAVLPPPGYQIAGGICEAVASSHPLGRGGIAGVGHGHFLSVDFLSMIQITCEARCLFRV